MAIDITKLEDDELLTALGEDDWVLTLPEGYADLWVPHTWRDELTTWACMAFVRWVLGGVQYHLTFENDPPWDHSGEVERRATDPLQLRALYATLAEWMENEYTGEWTPSFESGMGKYWERMEERVNDHVREQMRALFAGQYGEQYTDFDENMSDDVYLVEIYLDQALTLLIARIPTTEAWLHFEAPMRQRLLEEQRQAAAYAARIAHQQALARQFWATHFVDLAHVRIEYPDFRALGLEHRLQELFLDADPEVVVAIAAVGLPGYFSNRVALVIHELATASAKRK